jgi:hypothetical protein
MIAAASGKRWRARCAPDRGVKTDTRRAVAANPRWRLTCVRRSARYDKPARPPCALRACSAETYARSACAAGEADSSARHLAQLCIIGSSSSVSGSLLARRGRRCPGPCWMSGRRTRNGPFGRLVAACGRHPWRPAATASVALASRIVAGRPARTARHPAVSRLKRLPRL